MNLAWAYQEMKQWLTRTMSTLRVRVTSSQEGVLRVGSSAVVQVFPECLLVSRCTSGFFVPQSELRGMIPEVIVVATRG